jgi:hypothetical protein
MKEIKEYKIQPNPKISETCKTYISLNLKPTIEEKGEYKTFAVDYVLETLADELNHNDGADIFGITNKDLKEIENLFKQKFDFIELQF